MTAEKAIIAQIQFLPTNRKRSPAVLTQKVEGRAEQKNFLFLLEEKNGRAQNKKCRENFSARQAVVIGGGRRGGANGFFQKFSVK
ncbi:MAG: hypothetical protein ACP5OX_01940 [Minisyncoccia bacterium]